jgi:hypothetical protein
MNDGVRKGSMINKVKLGGVLNQRKTLVKVNDADKRVFLQDLGELYKCHRK